MAWSLSSPGWVSKKITFGILFKALAKIVDKAEYFFERNHMNLHFYSNS
jgi:hypothetical protein